MKLIKRIIADIRDPDATDEEVEMRVNEELQKLQTRDDGSINKNIQIEDVKEISKDSGAQVFIVRYDDKGLDVETTQQ